MHLKFISPIKLPQVVILECFWPMLELQACPEICLLAPGGDWGDIRLIGGLSSGNHILNDRAGNVLLEGGESAGNGIGGSIKLKSGRGSISCVLKLATSYANRMKQGSGHIHINSGQVSSGVSGNLVLETGSASLDRVARVQSKSKVGHQAMSAGTAASILTVTETFQTMKVEQLNLFLVRSMMESAGHST